MSITYFTENKSSNWILALASAILFTPPWYEWGHGLFLFIAFVPLLILENKYNNAKRPQAKVYLWVFFSFAVWNTLTTFWIKNASFVGLLAAITITTFLMSYAFYFYHIAKLYLGQKAGYASLIIFWIMMEFIYMHGEISWPWLTLGHGFAYNVKFIQWYEYTGVFGGSLWVLLVNLSIFILIKEYLLKKSFQGLRINVILLGMLIILPISISLIIFSTYKENDKPIDVVVVQPNVDPYLKFNDIAPAEQAEIQLNEALKLSDENVDFVAAPETSLLGNFWVGSFESVIDLKIIRQYVNKYPQASFITGIRCYERYNSIEEASGTAEPYGNTGMYYDSYNSAILVDTSADVQLYHKSQLVTGVEKMPYREYLGFIKKLTLQLGGTMRSHGMQEEREVFISKKDSVKIAPVICWESVFGEYVNDYIKKGAQVIFVITNDGWWGDTPGHRQHNSLSSIRAIETRRSIARSANTGISSFVNQKGEMEQTLTWWKRGALRQEINLNDKITFYVKHGDYIGRSAFWLGIMVLLLTVVQKIKNKSSVAKLS